MTRLGETVRVMREAQSERNISARIRGSIQKRSDLPPTTFAIAVEGKHRLDREKIEREIENIHQVVAKAIDLFDGDQNWALILFPGVTVADLPYPPFDFAYDLAQRFDLHTSEPAIPSTFYPEEPNHKIGIRSVDDISGTCWTPEEDAADLDPHWATKRIKAPEAWAYSSAQGRPAKGAGISVFQPDTGVVGHYDANGTLRLHRELENSSIDLSRAADIIDQDPLPIDPADYGWSSGHGTGTASVVVSREANAMVGAAPAATLVPVRCVMFVAQLDLTSVAMAVDHARRQPDAHIITMSLGGLYSRALQRAIARAIDDNILVMAAAGNCVGFVVHPAALPECIAVAGTTHEDAAWRGSCSGPEVDWSAPAEFVQRASAAGGSLVNVGLGQGTSFAVALSAGAAAAWLAHYGRDELIKSLRKQETLQDRFRAIAQRTADPHTVCDPGRFGAGILNVRSLLENGGPKARLPRIATGVAQSVEDTTRSVRAQAAQAAALFGGSVTASIPHKNPTFDWELHAMEVSWLIYTRMLRERAAASARLAGAQTVRARKVEVSDRLSAAIRSSRDPTLRSLLGA
ncbi:S8 family peptidase [Microvirga massiliensis]|uniref:S8 family peptidase n=1 Tax=Microvirga massiliensis TaxID=1033741 RepID=UPI00062BC611|nr:S8/S53 family peptidase [Microvirga massiliensis]